MPDRGDETRRRLRAATVEVILDRGWGGVTTRVVAERAGVRSGVVHYHFDSVDELRRAAVTHYLKQIFEPFIDMAAAMAPHDMVAAFVEAATNDFAPGTETSNLLFEALPAGVRDDYLKAELADVLGRFRTTVAAGIELHHPSPLAPPIVVAQLFTALMDGMLLHLMVMPDLDLSMHLEAFLQLLGPRSDETKPDESKEAK
ncbi:MAG: TetR/AcrR family transcriptional regulator [Actinomycetia bacterium]|nr:TetR/AcrR family transcriptional regulator [Actinomycetes bacterium]